MIVRLGVHDNRRPTPQSARSASLILRWPMGSGEETTGMEGIVRQTLPAYFRSQRQVIIDTEALVAERGKLPPNASNRARTRSAWTSGCCGCATDSSSARRSTKAPGLRTRITITRTQSRRRSAGTTDSVLEQFGHTHDIPEAATLLDRETRELLRAALGEMWQAELHLRQGQPERALPFEYRALDRIKQVQQASRIYLARVGLELPPIDATRRLTGEAAGVRSRGDPLAPSTPADALPAALWQRLGEPVAARDEAAASALRSDLESLARWVGERETELPQAIELLAAIDAAGQGRVLRALPCAAPGAAVAPAALAGRGDRPACDCRRDRGGLPRGPRIPRALQSLEPEVSP